MNTELGPVPADKRRGAIVRGIIISGWFMTLLMMMAIVGASLWTVLNHEPVPDVLAQWTGVAIGFLFGSFTSIVKEYITESPA